MNNWQDLYYLYVIQGKDLRDIGKIKQCSHEWVRHQLKEQSILIRSVGRKKVAPEVKE